MTLLSVQGMKTNIGQYSVLHGISFDVPEGGVLSLIHISEPTRPY